MSSTGAESEEKSAVCRCVADDKERRDLSQLESLGQLAPRSRALVGDVGGGIMNRGDWKRNGVEPWTTQENDLLWSMVRKHGTKKWSAIAVMIPGRTGKQCRERWYNHLGPEVDRGLWTKQEEDMILCKHNELGHRWDMIAAYLPGRTGNAIKHHWYSTLRKRLSAVGGAPGACPCAGNEVEDGPTSLHSDSYINELEVLHINASCMTAADRGGGDGGGGGGGCEGDNGGCGKRTNGYLLFCKERRSQVAHDYPSMRLFDVTRRLAEDWKSMSQEAQAHYKRMAKGQNQNIVWS